jgi:hypothetical protein
MTIKKSQHARRQLVIRMTTVATAGALLLSGCALNRAFEVKQQFCNFDENFSYSLAQNPQLTFNNPVIRDSDVAGILGFTPTEVVNDEAGILHRYVAEKVTLDGSEGESYALDLRYVNTGGKPRLQSVQLPPGYQSVEDMVVMVDQEAIAEAAEKICNSGVQLAFRSVEEDIDPRHLEQLPSLDQLIAMAGEPSWYSEDNGAVIYAYQMRGVSDEDANVRVVVWFDEAGERPLRMATHYREMVSLADFERGKVTFSRDG